LENSLGKHLASLKMHVVIITCLFLDGCVKLFPWDLSRATSLQWP